MRTSNRAGGRRGRRGPSPRSAVLRLGAALFLASTGTAAAQNPENTPEAMTRSWAEEELEDGDCAFGTPYRVFHSGLWGASDLLIWFQGGGACWDWVSCSGMFDTSVTSAELADYGGIFRVEDERNPFRDHAILFIPYCTGDLHVGDAEVRYGDDPSATPVRHHGYRNVTAALDLLADRGVRPHRIVVAGASAGSYGAVFWTPEIARRYPDAEIVTIGDSGVPLLNRYEAVLAGWNADEVLARIRDAPGEEAGLSLVTANEVAARAATRVAQITSDRDGIQSAFYLISGSPEWRSRTYAILDSVAVAVPSFRSYVVPGSDHGLLRTDRFYEYVSSGVPLAVWLRDFLAGQPVASVRCVTCGSR